MILTGRHVLLGVSGGIASYKTCTLVRELAEAGATVDVVLSASAAEFVRPVTFEALSGRPVLTSLWQRGQALAHVGLAREADLMVVAPATANLLARAAQGIADDLLTALLLARTGPVLVAPAMNDAMFSHPATADNLRTLRQRGFHVVGPEKGPLAEGPSDRPGRMTEPETILVEIERLLRSPGSPFAGKKVLVTAGPTRERLDPIRVLTNRSSGRMGFALARAAYARGAEVTLITGPTSLEPPVGPRVVRVDSTEELCSAVGSELAQTDVILMAAAPADFRPTTVSSEKEKRSDGPRAINVEPTTDVLEATRSQRKDGCVAVGFAYETEPDAARARAKLVRKGLDLIVLNADEPGSGAEVETNRVTLVTADQAEQLPLMSKDEVAERLLDTIERRL